MMQEEGHLLIVDDDETLRTMLARYFATKGFAVTAAPDGDKALAAVAAGSFDLVILDMVMPGRGLKVLDALRQTYSATDLPVIMATAKTQSSDVIEALRRGANDYLVKPFDLPVALARARTQLSLKRSVDRIACLERDLARRNAELEAANHRMKRDLEAAARVQKALLPRAPLVVPGVQLAWHFRPCDELAGDLLNVVRLDDRHVALYVLDVVGHGVKAALMAVMVSSTIAQLLSPPRRAGRSRAPAPMSPARVVAALDRAFPWDGATEQFCTLLYGVLSLETGRFDFVSAGHPGPLSISLAGEGLSLTTAGPPIGLGTGEYRVNSTTLRAGNRLYLYSDGVPETRGPGGQCFGRGRLSQALEQAHTLPLSDALAAVVHRIEEWAGPSAPHDDISILAVEYTGAVPGLSRTRRAERRSSLGGTLQLAQPAAGISV